MSNYAKIGVDFDDVLVPTNEIMSRWHNRVYGTSYQMQDIVSYDLTRIWKCTEKEMLRRIHEFYETKEHLSTNPVPDAPETIMSLHHKNMESLIVTARPTHTRANTERLVQKHFPTLLGRIHFATTEINGVSVRRSKADICKELGIEIFIDDCLSHAYGVASVGIPVLLFDRPWNQTEELPCNIERVYSWREIDRRLD